MSTVQQSVRICAVGDLHINRDDPQSALAPIGPVLQGADIRFANCEAIYSQTTEHGPSSSARAYEPGHEFRADPGNVTGLVQAGFDVASMANNVVMMYGNTGLLDTISTLRAHNIPVAGAGADQTWALTVDALVTIEHVVNLPVTTGVCKKMRARQN